MIPPDSQPRALSNPGDLSKEILNAVSSSLTVRLKFQECVDSVEVDSKGRGGDTANGFNQLFDFFTMKWHKMRTADFAKRRFKSSDHYKERQEGH